MVISPLHLIDSDCSLNQHIDALSSPTLLFEEILGLLLQCKLSRKTYFTSENVDVICLSVLVVWNIPKLNFWLPSVDNHRGMSSFVLNIIDACIRD